MCLFGIDREPLIVAEVTHLFLMQSFHLESLLLKKKKKKCFNNAGICTNRMY